MNDDTLKTELENCLALAVKDMARLSGVQIQGGHALFSLFVDPALGSEMETLRLKAEKAALAITGINKVTAILTAEKEDNRKKPKPLAFTPDIGKIIAVASGKGGVGKSTVALNLAVALAEAGYKTGLMDADVYGPSLHRMSGLQGQKPQMKDGKLEPLDAFGLKVMSMGFLVGEEEPMIWRGAMIQSAIRQFLEDVNWGTLDVLVVDMPPGTGDAQLTMAQKVDMAGAVIVSTPQDIALLDARKGIEMFRKVDVPILGLIENMSHYQCPSCGHEDHVFGHGGAQDEAAKQNIPFLGAIPLNREIRECADQGKPFTTHIKTDVFDRALKAIFPAAEPAQQKIQKQS
jgi:ATP-binding protein involved in chromosome partitioning